MALLLADNTYVKIDIEGNYTIYKNKTARNREKRNTSPTKIMMKYEEIIEEMASPIFQRYHVKDGSEQAWRKEYAKYYYNFRHGITNDHYPLMATYFSDVDKSIPEIIQKGQIGIPVKVETVEEVYNLVKSWERFGPIDEVKDI